MVSSLKGRKGTILPKQYAIAHELSFFIHDVMAQTLVSGEEGNFFTSTVDFENDNDKNSFEGIDDIFTWLEIENRIKDRAKILKTVVLPAILSDMLHCIYETLENSRKAKLNISYMLIRKPIQESLYVLEEIVLDELNFSEKLVVDPLKLRSQNAGGVENHRNRIQKVLQTIGHDNRLDALYIAQLRYDKSQHDSFDGICNHAMHLFTDHKAIKTEKLNINFIFSGWEEKDSQWSFLYTRLPYLLFYIHQIVEHIVESIAPTTKEYLDDMQRRISSLIILWSETIEDDYKCEQLDKFINITKSWLNSHCQANGYRVPIKKDLLSMSQTGAYPQENIYSVKKRNIKYNIHALLNKTIAKYK